MTPEEIDQVIDEHVAASIYESSREYQKPEYRLTGMTASLAHSAIAANLIALRPTSAPEESRCQPAEDTYEEGFVVGPVPGWAEPKLGQDAVMIDVQMFDLLLDTAKAAAAVRREMASAGDVKTWVAFTSYLDEIARVSGG